ncbi:MAG TPA: ester cyclase [Fibrobacteria bacterium]|nr:ester cyclase [Fibrobacteria bacterium]
MTDALESNKRIVIRFNREFIEQGSMQSFAELVAEDVVNHSAPPGSPDGARSMVYFILEILRKGIPDVKVDIEAQIAEGDLVTTRKVLRGRQTGEFLGLPPSGMEVAIKVIDIVRVKDGKYAEHWGASNLMEVLQEIRGQTLSRAPSKP